MASPDPKLMRNLVRDALDAPLRSSSFCRSGRRNVWTREGSGVTHAVGFYGSWRGGGRNLEWGVWVPGVEELIAAAPRSTVTDVAHCQVRGNVAGLLGPEDFPDRFRQLAGGVVPALLPGDDLSSAIAGLHKAVTLFIRTLDGLSTPNDVLALLLTTAGTRRLIWPRGEGLVDLYAGALAAALCDPSAAGLASRAMERLASNTTWRPSAERVAAAANIPT